MSTKPISTTEHWREMEIKADSLVPPDLAEQIPVRIADGGRSVRLSNSRVTLPVLIGLYRNGDSVERLADECFPQLEIDDVQAVIDYYQSAEGSWIDHYIRILYAAADLRHEDFKRRWEIGEFGSRRFESESLNGSDG